MRISLLGKKIGMTRVFKENGEAVAVTAIEVSPSVVTQLKSSEKDGYTAIQLGYGAKKEKHLNKAQKVFYDKVAVAPVSKLYEVRCDGDVDLSVGDSLGIDNFTTGDYVDITAVSKGKGFQGVMKRHNFSGGRASHGDSTGRRGGSIGQSATPARVFKGMKGPGRMGGKSLTVQNVEVILVDEENNLILVEGGVPGAKNNVVRISLSLKKAEPRELKVTKKAAAAKAEVVEEKIAEEASEVSPEPEETVDNQTEKQD